ncbi:MAG: hypothetical protein D6798_11510 [Deltaproteobacteria bacterium]|nr:MAG: hypothetical protein D6798_11510 [Deltaproteobacteria bacterium]
MRRVLPALCIIAAVVAGAGLMMATGLNRRFGPPDVVLITIDTLRADHVGVLSSTSPARTPSIDALAADGVLYTQAFSPISVTGPAFATLMTGQDPGTHGVVMNLFRGGAHLPAEATTLAERLHDRGFATAAFVSGFTLRRALGLDQGFATYSAPSARQRRRPGTDTLRRALRWLWSLKPWQRMLLWFHTYDVHGPLTQVGDAVAAGPEWARDPAQVAHLPEYQRIDGISDPEFYARRYAAAVEQADAEVGALIAALKDAGRYDRALIIFASDHGETLSEREPWMDHGTHASAEQLHVPLIVKYPRGARAGQRVDALVSLADIAPTVLALAGLDPLPGADGRPLDGRGHVELAGESSHCKDEPTLDCAPPGVAGKEFSLRTASRTVVRESTGAGPRFTVYDRRADPAELHPTAEAPTAEERVRLDAMAADRAGRPLGAPAVGGQEAGGDDAVDAEEEAALRALGYVE